MNSELLFGLIEEACKPLDCGAVPEIQIFRDPKQTLCVCLKAKVLVNGSPERGYRSYHIPLALEALKPMNETQLRDILEATRASLSQALTLQS